MALVAEYQVSRETVRTALRELRVDGVVLAERGRHPRPAGPVITQPLGTLYSLFASVESAGLSQESIIRRRDLRADGVIADRLGLEADLALTGLYAELARAHWRPGGRRPRAHLHRRADKGRAAPARDPAVHGRAAGQPTRLRGRPAGRVAPDADPWRPVLAGSGVLVPDRVPAGPDSRYPVPARPSGSPTLLAPRAPSSDGVSRMRSSHHEITDDQLIILVVSVGRRRECGLGTKIHERFAGLEGELQIPDRGSELPLLSLGWTHAPCSL